MSRKRGHINYSRVLSWLRASLAHVHENGRVVGFLLEKVEGRSASIQDFKRLRDSAGKFHELRRLYGDANRYNFLVTEDGVKLIDFENFQDSAGLEALGKEL